MQVALQVSAYLSHVVDVGFRHADVLYTGVAMLLCSALRIHLPRYRPAENVMSKYKWPITDDIRDAILGWSTFLSRQREGKNSIHIRMRGYFLALAIRMHQSLVLRSTGLPHGRQESRKPRRYSRTVIAQHLFCRDSKRHAVR